MLIIPCSWKRLEYGNFFVCYGSKPGRHFVHNLREFGVACLEELEVNH